MDPVNSGFPIFKLPILALRECILSMNPHEILLLCLCSKKSMTTIQTIGKMKSVDYGLSITQNSSCDINFIRRRSNPGNFSISIKNKNHEGPVKRVNGNEGFMVWDYEYVHENPVKEIRRVLDALLSFMEFPLLSHQMFLDCPQGKEILEWTITQKRQNDEFYYMPSANINEEMVIPFLDAFNGSKIVGLNCFGVKEFKYEKPFESEIFVIGHAPWFKMEHLYSFKCERLDAVHSELTNNQMNEFLKSWKSGTRVNEKLKFLTVEVKDFDLPEILRGINNRLTFIGTNSPDFGPIGMGHIIRKNDGTQVAMVYVCNLLEKPSFGLMIKDKK